MKIILLFLSLSVLSAFSQKPNIIFIFGDDIRNTSIGCAGHPVLKTPNMDRLAEKGVRFENAFVNVATCWASRATVLSGVSEHTHQYTVSNGALQEKFVEKSYPILLKEAGYKTGFSGKTHVKFKDMEYVDLFDEGKAYNRHFWKKLPEGKRHTTNLITDWGLEFIDKQSAETPFCLSLSYNAAHAQDDDLEDHFPHAKEEDGLYDGVEMPAPDLGEAVHKDALPDLLRTETISQTRFGWRWDTEEKYQKNMRHYYRLISGVDRSIGRVLDKLEEKGLLENTVVLYLADNGYMMGDRGMAGKWVHYEQSLRIPFIAADFRKEGDLGKVIKADALNLDVAPTILDLAGIPVPEQHQGLSLKNIIETGKEPSDWRADFLCEFGNSGADEFRIRKWQGVRSRRYVYAHYKSEEKYDLEILHDLEQDPTQLKNFATEESHQDALKQMRERLAYYLEVYKDRK